MWLLAPGDDDDVDDDEDVDHSNGGGDEDDNDDDEIDWGEDDVAIDCNRSPGRSPWPRLWLLAVMIMIMINIC